MDACCRVVVETPATRKDMARLPKKTGEVEQPSSRDAFQNAYVTLRNIPYLCEDASPLEGTLSGGVLATGQMVWTREVYEFENRPQSTIAFVEDIGIVSLDPRWLVRSDLLDEW